MRSDVDFAQHTAQGPRTDLSATEYAVLRQTIANRGIARMLVAPASCLGWAAITVFHQGPGNSLVAPLLSLAVLAAGFESVHALHVGTERIGRYLQVYYEESLNGPRWESTAMLVGPALPGGGIDPLFSGVFLGSALLNLLAARPSPAEPAAFAAVVAAHLAFAFRIVRARLAATRQRAVELESFKALQSRERAQN
jgi:hypothetical protein